jgi:hypothetical protein
VKIRLAGTYKAIEGASRDLHALGDAAFMLGGHLLVGVSKTAYEAPRTVQRNITGSIQEHAAVADAFIKEQWKQKSPLPSLRRAEEACAQSLAEQRTARPCHAHRSRPQRLHLAAFLVGTALKTREIVTKELFSKHPQQAKPVKRLAELPDNPGDFDPEMFYKHYVRPGRSLLHQSLSNPIARRLFSEGADARVRALLRPWEDPAEGSRLVREFDRIYASDSKTRRRRS